ncbi:phosphoadenylyl-sulfate reductase [Litorimonas sp. RW-G-Af-16]|uniref:phosphoadenylyl-sulfate reductase n=1 Tax=Litorimonas sp. RW-G-Af-16 TaxID=3241168 RepID=UPI00390CB1FE
MSTHSLIHNGRVRQDAFSESVGIDALDSNQQIDVLRLPNDIDLSTVASALDRVKTILIEFPAFTDGRGFSVARLLRKRHGFTGLLVADGELIPDQYAFALQCGFDAVRVDAARTNRQPEADWQQGLADFGMTYQRGYAVKAGPATAVFDARMTAFEGLKKNDEFYGYSALETLRRSIDRYRGEIVMASSLGVDSAVLLHLAAQIDRDLPIIFLDTGKHFRETLVYRDQLIKRLGLTNFQNIIPDQNSVKAEDPDGMLHASDPDACCNLRKVRPLDSVIHGYAARITGRKRYQTPDRHDMPILETGGRQVKVNPLAYWQAKDVTNYMQQHDLPPHPMLALGYLSIGCQPCTTRVAEGEDPRAGRWRNQDKTECGIHYIDGKWVSVPEKKTYEAF